MISDFAPAQGPSRAVRTAQGAAIASVGISVPERVVSSDAIADHLGLSSGWIQRRTGIHTRHIAEPHERLSSHAGACG